MTNLAVLIPVYRNQRGLERSLESLKAAAGAPDVVVVDDGSPQPIYAPSEFRGSINISIFRLEMNRGIAAALNHGLRHILGRGYSYVGRLDAGDVVRLDRFTQQVGFLDSHPECAVVSSFVEFVDATQRPLFRYSGPHEQSRVRRALHLNNCIMHPGATIRARVFRESGLYREDVLGAEDYELFLRMSRDHILAVLPEVLTYCEYSPSGLSVAGRRRQQKTRLKLQLRYFDPASPYSFLGVARTLLAMLAPQAAVFRFKRAHMH
jgi:glycosyltransferase involved in cell wall biosynthesis